MDTAINILIEPCSVKVNNRTIPDGIPDTIPSCNNYGNTITDTTLGNLLPQPHQKHIVPVTKQTTVEI